MFKNRYVRVPFNPLTCYANLPSFHRGIREQTLSQVFFAPYLTTSRNSSSVSTFTPNCTALSSLLPASLPATT